MNDYITNLTWIDAVGTLGTLIIVMVYFASQIRLLNSEDLTFPLANLIGALLIGFSLYYSFNFASAVMEFFWVIISLIGIYQWYRAR